MREGGQFGGKLGSDGAYGCEVRSAREVVRSDMECASIAMAGDSVKVLDMREYSDIRGGGGEEHVE